MRSSFNIKMLFIAFILLVLQQKLHAQRPAITSFTPSSGPVGTTATINGSNFNTTAENNIVYFGAVKGTVTSATTTSLQVNVPPGSTYQPISVTANGLTAYSQRPFAITFAGGALTGTSFSAKIDSTITSIANKVAIADLDGDGKPDLA